MEGRNCVFARNYDVLFHYNFTPTVPLKGQIKSVKIPPVEI